MFFTLLIMFLDLILEIPLCNIPHLLGLFVVDKILDLVPILTCVSVFKFYRLLCHYVHRGSSKFIHPVYFPGYSC